MERVALAYSGGLNGSAAISWLTETLRAEVVTVTLDIGQGHALDDVRERALAIGATRAHVVDAREEFARDFVLPALQAGAQEDGRYPLAAALARPIIARHLVAIARIEGAAAVAHGSSGDTDRVRFDALIPALDPALTIVAPASRWTMDKADLIAYARRRGTPVPAAEARADAPSIDRNLWGRTMSGGAVADSRVELAEDVYRLTEAPAAAPDEAAYVELAFERGVPLAVNGVEMPLVELMASLETIAGAHGVGRVERLAHATPGASREIVEAPAAVVLHAAHRALQKLVSTRDLDRLTADLAAKYADLVDAGLWFTPTREATDALIAKVQERVTGVARVKLFKGQCQVVGAESPFTERVRGPRRPARSAAARS